MCVCVCVCVHIRSLVIVTIVDYLVWIGVDWLYGISSLVGYLMPNSHYTYILDIYYLVWLYGISTIVSYLLPNSLGTFILNIYDLVWIGFMTIVGYSMPNPFSCI